MADLIPCPSCKKKISVEAQACPKCGQPITDEARAAGLKKMKEEKRAGRVGCIFFIIGAIAIAVWLGKVDKTDKTPPTPAPVSQPAPAAQPSPKATPPLANPTFGISAKQFVSNFNKVLTKIGSEELARIRNTSATSAQVEISKCYGVFLTLDKSGNITSLMAIGAGEASDATSAEIVLGIKLSIAGLKPDWPPSYRGEILNTLIGKAKKNQPPSSTVKDGVKFSLALSEGVGIIFTAEPEK